jgi:hypothetical protein
VQNNSTVQALGAAANKANAERFAANIIPIIREIQTSGVTTLRGVARALNARGVQSRTGRPLVACYSGERHQALNDGCTVSHRERDVRVTVPVALHATTLFEARPTAAIVAHDSVATARLGGSLGHPSVRTCPFEALGTISGTTPHLHPHRTLTKSGVPLSAFLQRRKGLLSVPSHG